MQLTRSRSFVFLGLALLQCGCASLGGQASTEPRRQPFWQATELSPAAELNAAILAGELAQRRQLNDVAARQYATAARLSEDPKVAARATQLALQAEDTDLAMAAARRWIELAPEQDGAYEVAARLALRQADFDQAVALLQVLVGRAGEPPDRALLTVTDVLSVESLGLEQALALYQQTTAMLPASAGLAYGRGLLAYRMGGNDTASAALIQALDQRPNWRQAQMLLLRLHLQAGETEAAVKVIRDLHVESPRDLNLRLALGALLLEHEQLELARNEFATALKIDADNASARFALGLIALDSGHLVGARTHFARLLELGERSSDAAYYLGRIAENQGQPDEALDFYRRVDDGGRVLDAAIRQAVIISQKGELAAARQYLLGLRGRHPQHALRLLQVEGELLYQAGAYDAAEEVYSRALEDYAGDADLLYGRAVVYERNQKFVLAEQDLRRIIKADPDDARALNALGYMLSNHTQRLDEAGELLRKALELAPDDPAVIDSMGWLHFRRGEHDQARVLLERAYAMMPDPEIAAHLGEVLWLQGELGRARKIWRAALQDAPEHKVLRETIRRLDVAI